jgi:hypothetical protein
MKAKHPLKQSDKDYQYAAQNKSKSMVLNEVMATHRENDFYSG